MAVAAAVEVHHKEKAWLTVVLSAIMRENEAIVPKCDDVMAKDQKRNQR